MLIPKQITELGHIAAIAHRRPSFEERDWVIKELRAAREKLRRAEASIAQWRTGAYDAGAGCADELERALKEEPHD